jgi:hypothetical protein
VSWTAARSCVMASRVSSRDAGRPIRVNSS